MVRHCGETYDDIVLVGGFSKAYSSLLAFIACPTEVKDLLKVAAPPYLYSGPSPVASLASVLVGFDVNERRGDELRRVLRAHTRRVLDCLHRLGVHTPNHSGFPIVEIPLRDHRRIDAVGRLLFDRGVYVTLAAYPLVPRDEVGFRVQLTAANTDAEIDMLIAALEELAEAGELRTEDEVGFVVTTSAADMTIWARIRALSLWQVYLAAGALICALYVWVPPFAGSGPVFNLLGLSPVVAIVVGVRRHRAPRRPVALVRDRVPAVLAGRPLHLQLPAADLDHEVPFPSLGDAAYLIVYPALMAGLLILVRRRNPERDRAGAIDSLIMTLGLALISWIALIQPSLHDDELSTVAKLVSIAYPIGDILLLAAAIRLAVDTGTRRPAFYLLASSIVALLATDFAYGLVTLAGAYDGQVWLDIGWISFYLLWGAAALHPSMRELERAAPDRDPRLTPLRLVLLTCASLIAPVMALLQVIDEGDDRFVVNVAAILLFGLVVARMAGLVRQQERSVARERILSAAGADLVAATSRADICHAALAAARALAGDEVAARLCLVEGDRVVVADGRARCGVARLACHRGRPARTRRRGRPARARRCRRMQRSRTSRRPPSVGLSTLMLALSVRGETHGLLAIAGEKRIPRALQSSLAALATEVSLALESAALTEEVHRRTSEARFGSLVQHASDLITVLDATGLVVYQSPSIERVLGYAPEELVGTRFDRLLQPGEEGRLPHVLADPATHAAAGTEALECGLRHTDGGVRQFEVLYTDLLDDENVHGVVLNSRDVSERKAFEEQLAHQAFHDPVTNLANRALFVERVRHAAGAHPPRRCAPGGDLHGSRRLQDDQRQPRARGRRRGAARRSPSAWTAASARATRRRASAATSSPSCSRTWAAHRTPPTRPSGSSSRSPRRCGWRARSSSCAAASASRSPRATPRPAPTS